MFFKKRKLIKQLLQEIEELKETHQITEDQLRSQRSRYFDWWDEKSRQYDSIKKNIKTINAACIGNSRGLNEEDTQDCVMECLCQELAQQIMPYVSYEKYRMIGEPWEETKHIATIKIVTDQK